MSFLSRRPSRPGSRDGDAGRDDEYGDYDYAPDGYGGGEDENWSPGQYFSPEGIKGRWADGQRSGDRSDARGRRGEAGRGDSSQGYEDGADDGYGAGRGYGYGADEYATGAYDLPEGSDEEPAERSGRRRKDKDRGERTGVFRLRRDRGEDIWPDDGISDEDYWASVASDRPLTGANPPVESDSLAADSRPMGRPGGPASSDGGPRMPATGGGVRAGAGPRPGPDSRTGSDQRFADEQRGVTGRLGPPPGLRGDYQPGAPISARPGTGPQAARPGTGPIAARPGTGAQPVRSGASGSAGAWSSQAGFAQSGTGSASYRTSGPQASYQPGGPAGRPQDSRETDSRQADSRQADRGADWGERTERIDRVNASGYPEPRGNSRQGPGRPGPSRTSGPAGAPAAVGRAGGGANGEGGWGSAEGADRRAADRDNVRDSGGWPSAARGGAPADRAGDDDPLTSRAYSRAAVSAADGRSYRVAARRSQAQAKLTEQATATFTAAAGYPSEGYRAGQHQTGATEAYPAGQHQTGATAEYRAAQRPTGATNGHRSGQYPASEHGQYQADAQASAARYPGYGSQPGQSAQSSSHAGPGQSSQPIRRGNSAGSAGQSGQATAGGPSGVGRPTGPSAPHGPGGFGRPSGSGGPKGAGCVGPAERPAASRQLGSGQPAHRVQPALRTVSDAVGTLATAAPAAAAAPELPAISARRPVATPGRGQREPRRQREPGGQRAGPDRAGYQRAEPVRVSGHGFLSVSQPALSVRRDSLLGQRPPGSGEPRPGGP